MSDDSAALTEPIDRYRQLAKHDRDRALPGLAALATFLTAQGW